MSDVQLVVVRSFGSRPEADLAKSALEAAGIDAMVRADSGGDMRPAMAWGGDGFQIIVRSDDAEAAREILNV
jgi:hypothetical protein